MKPPAFRYYRPTSTSEATSVLVEDEDALVLAGGQSLIPLLNLRMARPSVLVDVSRIPEMQRIRAEEHWFSVGAAVRQRSLEESPMIRRENGALIEALGHVGHRQIRVRGTVGGSLAHADPVGELPCLAVAGGWTICVRGADGVREVEADGFFLGAYTTALRPGELIESRRIPRVPSSESSRVAGETSPSRHSQWSPPRAGTRQTMPESSRSGLVTSRSDCGGQRSRSYEARGTGPRLRQPPMQQSSSPGIRTPGTRPE